MLSTQYLTLFRRHFNQKTLIYVSRYLNDGQLDDFQKKLTKEELKRAVADAASFDEKTGVDQVYYGSCRKIIPLSTYLIQLNLNF
jgi:hypothetical protein